MSAENKEAGSRRNDAAPDTKQQYRGADSDALMTLAAQEHVIGSAPYGTGKSNHPHYRQTGHGGHVQVAPTVGMEAGRMGSGDGTGGYLSGYRSAQSGYPSQHSPSMAPYTQPVQRQPGVPPGRLQMSVGPIMPNPPSYHVPTAPPMPGFGQIPRGPAMVVQPQPIMYGNAPTLGYQPTPPPQQTYYGQPRYDDPYTYGSQILGNPGAISASQIVPLLPMDQAQRGQPFGYQLPLHAAVPTQLNGTTPKSKKAAIVIKDKDGNILDLAAVKNAPTPAPSAAPAAAVIPAAATSAKAVEEKKPILEVPLTKAVVSPVFRARESVTMLTEGDGDIVIEGPDVDLPTIKASSIQPEKISVVKTLDVKSLMTEPSRLNASIGPNAFSSDFIIEPPEEDEIAASIPEPEPPQVPPADCFLSIQKAEVGVQAPFQPAAETVNQDSESPNDDDDWETSEIPDINKLHLAAKEERPSSATVPDFIFPASKATEGDVKRNKKTSKRDKYASADAAPESSGLLDAYTVGIPVIAMQTTSVSPAPVAARTSSSSPATISAAAAGKHLTHPSSGASSKQTGKVNSKPPTKVPGTRPSVPIVVPKAVSDQLPTEQKFSVGQSIAESEKKTSALYVPPALVSNAPETNSGSTVRRSLRPGGGKTQEVLNVPGAQANRPRLTYTKKEIKALIPIPMCERPPVLQLYSMITIFEGNTPRQVKAICMSGTPQNVQEKSSSGGKSGGFSSDKWAKQSLPGQAAEDRSTAGPPPSHMNSPHQYNKHGYGRKRNVPTQMPKKQYDQIEKYCRDVQGILNKISPGNFQKLIVDLCNIPCVDAIMMNKLISLIFEKALQEPSFSKMYADMCFYIEHQSAHILCNFFYIVHYEATLQYRWVRDLKLPMEFTGPFTTEQECLTAMTTVTTPQMNQVLTGPLIHFSLTLRDDFLIQVAKIVDKDIFYTNRLPLSDVEPGTFSERFFANTDAATKDYIKKNGFRRSLVTACQNEFVSSVQMENKYFELIEKWQAFELNKNNMSEDDKLLEALGIDELESKLKRRMLGNIRFIGELFKSNMLREANIFDCIDILMKSNSEVTNEMTWKVMDERSIEILCKLVTTVGEDIRHQDMLDSFFDRIQDLSVDKSLNSRMRFMLIEIIDLRGHKWAGRETKADKNAYVGGFIHTILPPDSPVIRQIGYMPGSLVGGSSSCDFIGTNRPGRSGSGSATNSPMDSRSSMASQSQAILAAASIAPTLFANPPSHTTPVRHGSPSIPLAPAVVSPAILSQGLSPSITLGKTRRPSAGGGSFETSSWRSPSPGAAGSAVSSVEVMTTPIANKRKINVDGVMDDYFSLDSDSDDAIACIDDLRQCLVSEVVSKLLERALEARPKTIAGIVKLALQLCPYFSTAQVEVEAAIESAEAIKLLGDMVLDYKESPEHLGAVVGVLVNSDACDRPTIQNMIAQFQALALDDEFAAPDVIKSAFSRFKASASM